MKTTLITLTLIATCQLYGKPVLCLREEKPQIQNDSPEDSLKKAIVYNGGDIGIGGAYGIHPNYRNAYAGAFAYVEGQQKFSVKGSGFSASFRLSNEKYRSGQASFFRLSYEGASGYRSALQKRQFKLDDLSRALSLAMDSLSKIEGRLSYLRLKQLEWEQRNKSGLHDSLALPEIPDLPGLPTIDKPAIPDPSFPTADIERLELLKKLQLEQIEKLKLDRELALGDYNKLRKGNYTSFLEGIKRFDLGLTSLSRSSMSSNAVPINGVNLSGEWRQWFYSFAAGFSLPSQLFSSQAFDQLISNSGNVFNMNNFFAVSNVRLASSSVIGYGVQDKNCVAVETFYTGRSFDEIRNKKGGETSTAVTISGAYTPQGLENLTLKGSLSKSMNGTPAAVEEKTKTGSLAYAGELNWKLLKLNGQLKLKHRNLGADYDGWSQGIMIRGAETTDLSYKQRIKNRAAITVRGAYGKYSSGVTPGLVRNTKQGGIDAQVKLSRSTSVTGSYTLLEASGDSLSRYGSLNHLGFIGLNDYRHNGKWNFTSSVDGSAAAIHLIDSVQQLIQLHAAHRVEKNGYYAGVKLTYTDFNSVGRVYGTNTVIAPEAGMQYKSFKADLSYQFLVSEQFGRDNGFVLNLSVDLGDLFTLSYGMQRWLPTDYIFFLMDDPYLVKPLYINGKLILHLK